MIDQTIHVPVMLTEVIAALQAEREGIYLDCTLGGAGHTRAILEANPKNAVVAIDRDARAIERARAGLSEFGPRIEITQGSFSELSEHFSGRRFSGVLADLGLSSDQLQETRGFSFKDETPLDMRMDERQHKTADLVVNLSSERELEQILKRGGVARDARALARGIINARPLRTARELALMVQQFYRSRNFKKQVDPATIVFQAIRIEVNDELLEIKKLLEFVPGSVEPGGRLVVISFHSLEDQIVTKTMRGWENQGTTPVWWRGPRNDVPALGKVITRKAGRPEAEEVELNPRSRSSRLRVFEFH